MHLKHVRNEKKHMRDAFSDCHPIVNFIFFIGALVMGMCFRHPAFLISSLVLSLVYYGVLKGNCLKYMVGMSGIFVAISLINPLFSTYGEHVLFTWPGGKPYTFEALCYGMAMAAMFVTILTWYATYNEVMTSDKFLYCFGRLAPSVSLILTMVLRLVPSFQKKAEAIAGARKCIGKSVENGSNKEKVEHGMTIVSSLTSWALEGGIVMADSMRSRGFGTGKRTSFSMYRFGKRDKVLLGLMIVLLSVIIICAFRGGTDVTYLPQIHISGIENGWMIWGTACYVSFLSIPTAMHIWEDLTWRILRSKI